MSVSSRSITYDAVLSLSLEYIRPTLIDNIFTGTPFLAAMYGAMGKKKKQAKGVRLQNGGERIRQPLLYGKNTTVGSYSGYDTLDVTPQEGITTAFFTWRQLAGSIAISRKEERQNAGEGKIRDLLDAKIRQCELTMRDELNLQLLGDNVSSGVWSAGSGIAGQSSAADLDPIWHIVPRDKDDSTEVGNIAGSYSWWQPMVADGSADSSAYTVDYDDDITTWAELKLALRRLYNLLTRGGGGPPDFGVCDQYSYEMYEAALDDKVRYVNDTDGPVTMGFESIRLKGQDVVWDEYMPDLLNGYRYDNASWAAGTWGMFNLDFMELVIDSQTNFITTPFVRPENQDAKVAQILFMGNLACNNRRKQGVLYGIDPSITS